MAKIVCKFCGKKIDEKYKQCPKCHKYLNQKNRCLLKGIMCSFWFLIQTVLLVLLFLLGKELFYSNHVRDLIIIGLFTACVFINSIVFGVFIYKKHSKKIIDNVLTVFTIICSCISLFYCYRIGTAIRYDNSLELLKLCENYGIDTAKHIKKEFDDIFEVDTDGAFSRDIIISNFYTDGRYSNLYLDDIYGNYRLKLYAEMDNFNVKDVFWKFNGHKLFLVKDGKKTDNFEFYYAMNILNEVVGEDINGLARLEESIEKAAKEEFEVSSNAMLNFEELDFQFDYNIFSFDGNIYNMDYSGSMEEKKFTVTFEKRNEVNEKHIWYYGDSSFDYVDWNISF